MEAVMLGFAIALAIGITGVGAGIITAPVLMLAFGVSAASAVGTSLAFGAVAKFIIAPAYALRGQINWRTAGLMIAGGLPGVAAGALVLGHFDITRYRSGVSAAVGSCIIVFALLGLYRVFRPTTGRGRDRPWLVCAIAVPIGAEVGFSSAGSGSLASLALMAFTRLSAAEIVGTDVVFGLALSLVGGGILATGGHYDAQLLAPLATGGAVGALVAPQLAARLPLRPFRIGLLIWIVIMGGNLVVAKVR